MTALRVLALALATLSAAGAAVASPNPAAPPACVNDARGSAALEGYLRVAHQSGLGSIVQLFAESDATDYYVNGIARQLSGRPADNGSNLAQDPNFMADTLRRMQDVTALLYATKSAVVDTDGKFRCSGYLPGRYVLLGTVIGTQLSSRGLKETQSYWRADVMIPAPNRRQTYLVPEFRLLGGVASP